MVRTEVIALRVSNEKKAGFQALAASRGMSESKLLDLLIETVLDENPVRPPPAKETVTKPQAEEEAGEGSDRVTIRLRPGDGALLKKRAEQRGLARSTYLAALVRAHVRHDPPMPQAELAAVKQTGAELSAIGRNLNQIARSANQNTAIPKTLSVELQAVLDAVEPLRGQIAAIVKANLKSWESNYA